MDQPRNQNQLREVERIIVAAVVISSDGKFLLGQKDPDKGGVYPDAWHIPGGGIEDGEDMEKAMRRELREEVPGLPIDDVKFKLLDVGGGGETERDLKGERVWVIMHFNHFEVRMSQTADDLVDIIQPGDDLATLQFFTADELKDVQQIPGGKEIFIQLGYIVE